MASLFMVALLLLFLACLSVLVALGFLWPGVPLAFWRFGSAAPGPSGLIALGGPVGVHPFGFVVCGSLGSLAPQSSLLLALHSFRLVDLRFVGLLAFRPMRSKQK